MWRQGNSTKTYGVGPKDRGLWPFPVWITLYQVLIDVNESSAPLGSHHVNNSVLWGKISPSWSFCQSCRVVVSLTLYCSVYSECLSIFWRDWFDKTKFWIHFKLFLAITKLNRHDQVRLKQMSHMTDTTGLGLVNSRIDNGSSQNCWSEFLHTDQRGCGVFSTLQVDPQQVYRWNV